MAMNPTNLLAALGMGAPATAATPPIAAPAAAPDPREAILAELLASLSQAPQVAVPPAPKRGATLAAGFADALIAASRPRLPVRSPHGDRLQMRRDAHTAALSRNALLESQAQREAATTKAQYGLGRIDKQEDREYAAGIRQEERDARAAERVFEDEQLQKRLDASAEENRKARVAGLAELEARLGAQGAHKVRQSQDEAKVGGFKMLEAYLLGAPDVGIEPIEVRLKAGTRPMELIREFAIRLDSVGNLTEDDKKMVMARFKLELERLSAQAGFEAYGPERPPLKTPLPPGGTEQEPEWQRRMRYGSETGTFGSGTGKL